MFGDFGVLSGGSGFFVCGCYYVMYYVSRFFVPVVGYRGVVYSAVGFGVRDYATAYWVRVVGVGISMCSGAADAI